MAGFTATPANVTIAVALTLVVLITIIGNLLVLITFVIYPKIRQPFNYFIANLAVTDFLVAVTAMTFYSIDTVLGYWPFGTALCGFWIYLDYAMTFASVFTLVAISVDRFWSVTWIISYKARNSRKTNIVILAIVWACVFAIWTPPFIGDRLKHQDEKDTCIWEPSENREFIIVVDVIGHYIPCVIMVVAYIKVYVVMKKQTSKITTKMGQRHNETTKSVNKESEQKTTDEHSVSDAKSATKNNISSIEVHPGSSIVNTSFTEANQHHKETTTKATASSPKNRTNRNREQRIFITLTYVVVSYLICWFPFYVTWDIYAWQPSLVPDWLYTFLFWMTYINSTLNPILYAYTSRDFRVAFKNIIKCNCKVNNW